MIEADMKSTFAFLVFLLVLCGSSLNLEAQDNQNIPSRVEIGGVMSAGTQSEFGTHFHPGEGGRVVINVTKFLAGEAEATRQPTDNGLPIEIHTFLAAKVTYRAEQRRWLKFAGLNFFGVVGPAFVNRYVDVEDPNPPQFCFNCVVQQRQTAGMLEWGGGFEVVPARAVAVRFDVTHANFSQPIPYSNFNETEPQARTYLKVAVMLRFP